VPAAAKLKRGDSADALFKVVKRILMADGQESLVVRDTGPMPSGIPFGSGRYFFTDQQIGGIPVLGSRVNFVLDPKGQIVMINSLFVPQGEVSTTPQISLETARAELESELAQGPWADPGSVQIGEEGTLAFWTDTGTLVRPVLLWMIPVRYTKDKQPQYGRFGVDTVTGEIRCAQPMSFSLHRSVYTNNYRPDLTTPLPQSLLWQEGQPVGSDQQALSIWNRVLYPINAWAGSRDHYDVVGLVAHWG
jgi:hypothetical protein